jgi:hypothetical protein
MYAERARATGNLDAIAILDGEKKPVTKEELLREDRREYLAGLLEGLTGKYVNLYGKRKATLIKEILTKQEEVLRDARTESKTETTTETTDKSKEATTMKKVTVNELRAQAKAAGIKGYSRMTKAELEAALELEAILGNRTLTDNIDEEDENCRVSLEQYYEEKMRKDFNEFVKRLYGKESEITESPEAERKELGEVQNQKMSEYPPIGFIHGKPILRNPEYTEDSIDVEAMERESEGLKKLYPDEWELELEALNRAELDYLCRKFGIKVTQETPKSEKRQKLLKYLEEGGKNKVA